MPPNNVPNDVSNDVQNDVQNDTPAGDPDQLPGTAPDGEPSGRLYVKAVEKAFRVLEAFADATGPLTLSQLAAAASMDKSGAQRMAYTLTRLGYLQQVQGGLRSGPRILERSFDHLRNEPLVRRAYPLMLALREETRERVDLSRFDDIQITFLMRMPGRRHAFHAALTGSRLPSFCTAGGRAALSCLSDAVVDDVIRRSRRTPFTPHTITAPEHVAALVAQARADGVALASQEVQPGEVTLAAPVLDEAGRPAGAIHLAGSLGEWTPDSFRRRFAPLVVAAAHAASFP